MLIRPTTSSGLALFCLTVCLAAILSACDKNSSTITPEYSPEIFNAKWMSGAVHPESGNYFLVGEQGSIARSENGEEWVYSDTPVTHTLLKLAVDIDNGILIAVGEAGTVLRSTNNGHSWEKATLELPKGIEFSSTTLRTVLYDSTKGIWLAAGTRNAILRSADKGLSWQLISYNTADTQLEILDLFADAQTKDLWFAAQHGTTGRSADGGLTWDITQHDMEPSSAYIPHVVGFHQYDNTLIATADQGRLLISKNNGNDWTLMTLATTGYFTDSTVDTRFNTIVMTTQMGEIALSKDEGNTWQIVTFDVSNWPSDDIPFMTAVVFDENSKSLIAAGNSGVIARSTDGGETWFADIFKPTFNLSVTTLLHNPKQNKFILAGLGGYIAASDKLASAAQPVAGWKLVRPGIDQYMRQIVHIPQSNTFVMVGQLGGVWRTEDDGLSWKVIDVNYPHPNQPPHLRDIILDEKNSSLVAAGPAGSIIRSLDSGVNWNTVFQGAINKGEAFTQILQDKKRDTLLACEVLYRSVYRSEDGGANWARVSTIENGERNVWHGAISEKLDLVLVVGQRASINISADGGNTWQTIETNYFNDLYGAFADENSGALFAVGQNGIILRSENGNDWQKIESNTASTLRRIVAEPKSGALLAFGQQASIVRSLDHGKHWTKIKTPIEDSELRHAFIEPKTQNLIVVGTSGVMLRTANAGESWQLLPSHTLQHFRSAASNPETGTLIVVGDGLVRMSTH